MDIKKLKEITSSLKVLYVEDDKDTRVATLKLFKHFFNHITVAINGRDGVERFKEDNFDLIISDIVMPHLTGVEMLEEIRKENSDIPILFFSAFNESKNFIKAIELGTDYFIPKPIQRNQLIIAISKVAEKINLRIRNNHYKEHLEGEIHKRTKSLEYKFYHDTLTGLLNRVAFFEQLEKLSLPVIFLIDINKFKVINKVYGDKIGSEVLSIFAQFLLSITEKESYLVYRLSGNEFVILDDTEIIDHDKYEIFISDFFNKLKKFQIVIDKFNISIDVTIGISAVESGFYESAQIALEYAKEHNKQYIMYSESIDTRQNELQLLNSRDIILSAIDQERVKPVYQPIVNSSGNTIKYETLMRLQMSDSEKLIYPSEFLDIAIKTRLYETLSSIIIFTALDNINTIRNDISLNFTYSDIENKLFMHKLEKLFINKVDLGKHIIFEITESESIKNYDIVKKFINRFRKFGVRIAIDDFGSGFSNFEHILEIKPDYLKIDGSLIKSIDTNSDSYTMVQAIVDFSHRLGIKVIAEYVHSKVIFDMLKVLNVDEYQGFYFSEPILFKHLKLE